MLCVNMVINRADDWIKSAAFALKGYSSPGLVGHKVNTYR